MQGMQVLKTLSDLDRECAEIEANSQWVITADGLDTRDGRYYIDKDKLHEMKWLLHMSEKSWVNMSEFVPAFFRARHKHFPNLYPTIEGIHRGEMDTKR